MYALGAVFNNFICKQSTWRTFDFQVIHGARGIPSRFCEPGPLRKRAEIIASLNNLPEGRRHEKTTRFSLILVVYVHIALQLVGYLTFVLEERRRSSTNPFRRASQVSGDNILLLVLTVPVDMFNKQHCAKTRKRT